MYPDMFFYLKPKKVLLTLLTLVTWSFFRFYLTYETEQQFNIQIL